MKQFSLATFPNLALIGVLLLSIVSIVAVRASSDDDQSKTPTVPDSKQISEITKRGIIPSLVEAQQTIAQLQATLATLKKDMAIQTKKFDDTITKSQTDIATLKDSQIVVTTFVEQREVSNMIDRTFDNRQFGKEVVACWLIEHRQAGEGDNPHGTAANVMRVDPSGNKVKVTFTPGAKARNYRFQIGVAYKP